MSNANAWESPDLVSYYAGLAHLFPPEKTVFELLHPDLSAMSMLDIGVGGGRTAIHFAKAVGSYVGIDASSAMIEACIRRLPGVRFERCDARDLSMFPDRSFDFVLFSFNGIDNLEFADRQRALDEIRRVARPGSKFFFSTHNVDFVEPLRPFKSWKRAVRASWENFRRRQKRQRRRAMLRQRTLGESLIQAHISDETQREDLQRIGARRTQLLSVWDGSIIPEESRARLLRREPWLNYLCEL